MRWTNNPGIVNTIVIGPWNHGGWSRGEGESLGNVHFGSKTAEFFREKIELPFLKRFLKDDSKQENLPEAYVFETGTAQWRKYDSWPPKQSSEKKFYLHSGGKLSFQALEGNPSEFDEYISDPAKPVPLFPT